MKKLKPSKPLIVALDMLIFLVCLVGLYQIANRPDLPFKISPTGVSAVDEIFQETIRIESGDIINDIDGYVLTPGDALEIYIDGKNVGDKVNISYSRKGNNFNTEIILIHYYSDLYVISAGSIGFLFLLFAMFVSLKRFDDPEAQVFHWLCIGVMMILMLTWGTIAIKPEFAAFLTRSGFHLGYTFVPALLIHFVLIFPFRRGKSIIYFIAPIYVVAGVLTLVLTILFINYYNDYNNDSVSGYILLFNISRLFIAFSVIFSIILLIRTHRKTSNLSDKKRLKWIIYGLSIGPFLFIFLWVIPSLILNRGLVPEELIIISVLSVPVAFSISIIKYHLFDIDVIINRSLVYSILIALIILGYSTVVLIISNIIDYQFASVIFAILIGLLFHPVKVKVQKFVDRKFFRVQYDFRTAIRDLFRRIKDINNITELAENVVAGVDTLIPVKLIGMFLLKSPENKIKLIAHKNFDLLVGRSVSFQPGNLKTDLSLPVALEGKFEPGVDVEIADSRVFSRWEMDIVFPLKSSEGEILGFLVLGAKKSGNRFNLEDIDLLNTLSIRIASSMERIKLQEAVIHERLEAERLDELNKMKTFFVSSVSHDLKTPITSIKMFSGFVQDSNEVSDKDKEYLGIIEGESDRLTRFIDSVLNYTMIEKGIRNYNMEKVSLNNIVESVLGIMNYQLKLENFNICTDMPDADIYIKADNDAVEEAVINLMSNSIKYSGDQKEISLKVFSESNEAVIKVSDKGIGMSEQEKANIFNEYYQIGEKGQKKKGGVGIGLTIVKHVMDAHNGKIEVESEPARGTIFKLSFPVLNGE